MRPHNRAGDESSIFPITQAWPLPYLNFTREDDRGTLGFQSDRFVVSWSFSEGVNDYPGFDALAQDLESKLDQFIATVRRETGQEVSFSGSECVYRNAITEVSGEELAVGVLTRWSGMSSVTALHTQYAGVRMHFCTDEDMEGCSVTLSVDVDDDGPSLTLDSERDLEVDEQLPLGGLQVAHDQLIRKFLEYTSDAMQKRWERQ
ncbi:hypothetical protein [Aeromicrobium endophyticum]|uniref:Uncharacterized protein n=1 Tax=Aeromicrobium endophyticum TaxID=2292704 RepID=A0A371P876_9ACTN|nr:hypothetical protein [Aeromicrobium endophyticum]REK72141.1 hypothetical protein DX116_00355 [Aeromicrobium endophyticum]